jgi:hypothetical protein
VKEVTWPVSDRRNTGVPPAAARRGTSGHAKVGQCSRGDDDIGAALPALPRGEQRHKGDDVMKLILNWTELKEAVMDYAEKKLSMPAKGMGLVYGEFEILDDNGNPVEAATQATIEVTEQTTGDA